MPKVSALLHCPFRKSMYVVWFSYSVPLSTNPVHEFDTFSLSHTHKCKNIRGIWYGKEISSWPTTYMHM